MIDEYENAPQEQRLSDDEIVSTVKAECENSLTEWDGSVSGQRSAAYQYYYGQLPSATQSNTNDHVSMEVFDSVESIKAKGLRAFGSNRRVMRFKPLSEDDVKNAELRTEYVHRLFWNENPGYQILHDILHDGAIGKLATVKRWFEEKTVSIPEVIEGVPVEQLEVAYQQGDISFNDEDIQTEWIQAPIMTPAGPVEVTQQVASGTIYRDEPQSKVAVSVIPPEDGLVSATCRNLYDGSNDFWACRYEKPKYELINEGFDPEVVKKLSNDDALSSTSQRNARDSIDGAWDSNRNNNNDERQIVVVYEAYIYLDLETPKGETSQGSQLWQIIFCGNELLHKERVDEIPARYWSPFMISHKAIGMSVADITMDIQHTDSNIVRGLVDHIYRTNTGTKKTDLSLIRNPRDLIDNPIGGIINAPGNVTVDVIPQSPLSAATGQVVDLLGREKEQRTGDTALGKGLQSQDALNHQNSADMVQLLMNAGNEKHMMLLRNLAEMCLKPLFLDLYRIGYENGHVVTMEVDGVYQEFDPRSIPFADEMDVDIALTPEYGQNKARQLQALKADIQSDPEMASLFGMKEKYAVYSEIADLLGQPNFLADPTSPETQQRLQEQGMRMQQDEEMQKQIVLRREQREDEKLALLSLKTQEDLEIKREDLDLEALTAADKQDLDEEEFKWQRQKDAAEIALEATQKRPVGI